MTKGCRAFLIAGNGKPRRGHKQRCGSPKLRDGRTTAGPEAESAQAYLAQNLPERIRAGNSRETHRTEKKAFRARADSAQSARQGGTEPGTTRFRDGRATTRPPAPRRGPGAPTAQPRPRGPDLASAQNLACGKICDFSPELGFDQRNRFRSLRDTRRTKKNVSRKPPAGAPVVGQTFKYIY